MNRAKQTVVGFIMVMLLGYAAWTTMRISNLESRLELLETSHHASAEPPAAQE